MGQMFPPQFCKLTLSANPIQRKKPFCRNKARDVSEVPPDLWRTISELCEGRRKWPLFIHGPVGTGKSSAALCLADRVDKSEFYKFPDFADYCHRVKDGLEEWYDCGIGGKQTPKRWWNYVSSIPLLVLDDIGLRELYDDLQMETLFLALEAREGKPFVCTSNLSEKGIEETYNERIRSRLCSGTVCYQGGLDRRTEDPDEFMTH
jgi:DNA replication protein DnaC